MKNARIGIIGGGIFGLNVLKACFAAQKRGEVELVCLADIKENVIKKYEKNYNIKGYLDYKEMIKKETLDCVAVVTPDYLHKEIALGLSNNGIHMLVEKPLDVSVVGAREMVNSAKENNLMLYVDFHKRLDPGHIQLKKCIQEGVLGNIQYGYFWIENTIEVPTVAFKSWAQHSSPAWFVGIHVFDLIYWLLESKPQKVYATATKDKIKKLGIDTYDSIQTKIEFENGASISVDSSWILPNSFPSGNNQGFRLVGSKGIWESDDQDRGISYTSEENGTVIPNYYGMLEKDVPGMGNIPQGYIVESVYHFIRLVNMLKNGTKLEDLSGLYPSGEEAIISTQICEAAHISAETGKIIELDN